MKAGPTSPGRQNKVLALGLSHGPENIRVSRIVRRAGIDSESDFTNVEAAGSRGKGKPPVGFPYGPLPCLFNDPRGSAFKIWPPTLAGAARPRAAGLLFPMAFALTAHQVTIPQAGLSFGHASRPDPRARHPDGAVSVARRDRSRRGSRGRMDAAPAYTRGLKKNPL